MKLNTTALEASVNRLSASLTRNAATLRVCAAVSAAAGCYLLCSRQITIPPGFSLLHGPAGAAVGVGGVFLALVAVPPLRACLVIAWLCLWFTTGLAELRASAVTDGAVVGGIIPYSDSSNFMREASRLIEGSNLTSWASRPLSDTYLAGLLYVAGGHLVLALALAGASSAAAIGLAAIELRKSMGLLSATLWTWLMLVYCRRYFGEMLSEQAGIAFGALGLAFLLRAFAGNSLRCTWPGLFILSLALNARAGAFVVLPVLVAAAAWRWRHSGWARILALAALSVAAAFMLSILSLKLIASKEARLMTNYHGILYGVVFGGNWEQAAADIPNYGQMTNSARAAEIDRRISVAIRADPSLIWKAAERNWSDFFTRSDIARGPFSFFRYPKIEFLLIILSGIGLLWSLALWYPVSPLVFAAAIGILLSVPFVPTPDADLMRAYAATMPLMFIIPAFSFAGWRACTGRLAPASSQRALQALGDANERSIGLNCCALLFVAVMLVVPLFARFVAPMRPAVTMKDKGSDIELTLDLDRATWIELSSDGGSGRFDPRRISAAKFKLGIFGSFHYFYPRQAEFLEKLSRPEIVLACSGSTDTAFLALDAKHMTSNGRHIVVLGRAHSADSDYAPSFLENSLAVPLTAGQAPP